MAAKKKSTNSKLLPVSLYELTEEDKKRSEVERSLGLAELHNPLLDKPAKEVKPEHIATGQIRSIIAKMFDVARKVKVQRPGAKRALVGLAAPQIGEPWRIILVDTKVSPDRKNGGQLECFINPEIIWRARETEEGREGCFSTGPVWGLVRRPVAVKIRAFTPEGEQIERIFEGFTARIMQHEIDHLEGVRFPDIIRSDKKRHWVHAEETPYYPKNIRKWPRICTRERWEALRANTNLSVG